MVFKTSTKARPLIGYGLRDPRSALALALLATPLIIIGFWTSIPDIAPTWESWANRSDTIGSVWLTAVFVWRIRTLDQELQRQIAISNSRARESAMLASIVEFGDDAIVSKNLDGIITSWNAGAERIFGYLAEEVIGKPETILIPPDLHHVPSFSNAYGAATPSTVMKPSADARTEAC
jgi:PAS domain-containing protein